MWQGSNPERGTSSQYTPSNFKYFIIYNENVQMAIHGAGPQGVTVKSTDSILTRGNEIFI